MKNKDENLKFKIARKGYDVKEVDLYLAKTEKDHEAALSLQKKAISDLEAELAEKTKKIEEFEAKAKRITRAITGAVAKAEEIEKLSLFKYNKEMEQLKTFHARWLTYYAKLIKKYPLTEDLEAVNRFNDKVNRILGQQNSSDDETARFREEFGKLIRQNGVMEGDIDDDIPSVAPATFIKLPEEDVQTEKKPPVQKSSSATKPKTEYKSVSYASSAQSLASTPSESGFSFEEALNPKQSLEEIMQDLGLLMGEDDGQNL